MTFNSPISILQSVFTKLRDVLPAKFFNIDWGSGGMVILVMSWDEIMQFSIVPRYFGQNCLNFKKKKLKRIDTRKLSISKEFELLVINRPI